LGVCALLVCFRALKHTFGCSKGHGGGYIHFAVCAAFFCDLAAGGGERGDRGGEREGEGRRRRKMEKEEEEEGTSQESIAAV